MDGDFGGAVQNKTNDVAELVAFIHALRYARTAPEARDESICLRHDSKYAALVSCGVYKGKKNKALVAIARDEWKLTAASKKAFSKGLWIRHVKGHSNHEWNNVADKLAGDGNFKRRTHCGPPWTLGPLVGAADTEGKIAGALSRASGGGWECDTQRETDHLKS